MMGISALVLLFLIHPQDMVLDLCHPVAAFPDQRDHRPDGISIRNDGFDRRIIWCERITNPRVKPIYNVKRVISDQHNPEPKCRN